MTDKTPASAPFLRRLVEVGDQISFSALRHWEFDQTLSAIAANRADDFTTAVFRANPFAPSTYRRISDLRSFSAEAEQVELKMGTIASVEHVLACLQEMQSFRAALSPSPADAVKHDAEEEQLRLKLEQWSNVKPVASYFQTIGFFRLLRNHYAHLNAEPHPALRAHVAAHATLLNRFWAKRPITLHGLDFKTLASIPLSFELAITIVNLLRVSILEIDQMLARTLAFQEIGAWALQEVLRVGNNKRLTDARLAAKVRARLEFDCGQSYDVAAVLALVTALRS